MDVDRLTVHWTQRALALLPVHRFAGKLYGERDVTIRFLCHELIWRPLRTVARFVLVEHPDRGRSIFITTDLSLPPIEVIRLYGLRFKIELSFKQALRVLGAYACHFRMHAMPKINRRSGTQHLHRASDRYRASVRRKLGASALGVPPLGRPGSSTVMFFWFGAFSLPHVFCLFAIASANANSVRSDMPRHGREFS